MTPAIGYFIVDGQYKLAFGMFATAGITDLVYFIHFTTSIIVNNLNNIINNNLSISWMDILREGIE